MTRDEFHQLLHDLFPDGDWPKPLHLLRGIELLGEGRDLSAAASEVRTTQSRLQQAADASDPIKDVLGMSLTQLSPKARESRARRLANMVLGRAAELAFEEVYTAEIEEHDDVELRDLVRDRTDTDYRLFDSSGRPIYRINVKYHGSRFRKASEMVNLDPHDCFALATYKIHGALLKEEEDNLPYFFAIVGVFDVSAEDIAGMLPDRLVDAVTLIYDSPKGQQKRNFEDRAVEYMAQTKDPAFQEIFEKIADEDWYILSARRANNLMREKMFERVYALRVRAFAQTFGRAEIDMHFSLSEDLIPLHRFVETLSRDGLHRVTHFAANGVF